MNKSIIKLFLLLSIFINSSLFAISNPNSITKEQQSLKIVKQNNKKKNLSYIKHINWDGHSPIFINIAYKIPTKIVFPGFIEKLEYMEGQGGIKIVKQGLSKGTQSLIITRQYDIKQDGIAYVSVLGKRIPLVMKYSKNPDFLLYVNFAFMNKQLLQQQNSNKKTEVFKIITYKNLTQKTNMKSVSMIVHMLENNAEQYYKEVPIENNKDAKSFFGSNDLTKEQYQSILFKKVFSNNKYFMTSYFNNEIIPEKIFLDNYIVYITDKNKKKLNIFGVKLKWCNYNKNFAREVNIDDIKVIIGKTLLAAYHPFKKIPPQHCADVYAVFYNFGKLNKF